MKITIKIEMMILKKVPQQNYLENVTDIIMN